MDKRLFRDGVAQFRQTYDFLSEFVHPNHLGILGLYSTNFPQDFRIEYGEMAGKKKLILSQLRVTQSMIWLVEIAAKDLDALVPAIEDLCPNNLSLLNSHFLASGPARTGLSLIRRFFLSSGQESFLVRARVQVFPSRRKLAAIRGRLLASWEAAGQGSTRHPSLLLLLADSSLSGHKVALALSQVVAERGAPVSITVDNGTECYSRAIEAWAYQYGVQLDFIRPVRITRIIREERPSCRQGGYPTK